MLLGFQIHLNVNVLHHVFELLANSWRQLLNFAQLWGFIACARLGLLLRLKLTLITVLHFWW